MARTELAGWIGRTEMVEGIVTATPCAALAATLDRAAERPPEGWPLPPPLAAPACSQWQRSLLPDEVLLFRYSALTLNGHRIHYDRGYATQTEGYPGLVVHGPLIATLLLDLLREQWPEAELAGFEFRAMHPAFDGRPLQMAGKEEGGRIHLWAADHEGWLAMDATAALRGDS